jgi:hypothetical protein
MAFSQADLENPHTAADMPSFDESKNVSDDVRGTALNWPSVQVPMLIDHSSPRL